MTVLLHKIVPQISTDPLSCILKEKISEADLRSLQQYCGPYELFKFNFFHRLRCFAVVNSNSTAVQTLPCLVYFKLVKLEAKNHCFCVRGLIRAWQPVEIVMVGLSKTETGDLEFYLKLDVVQKASQTLLPILQHGGCLVSERRHKSHAEVHPIPNGTLRTQVATNLMSSSNSPPSEFEARRSVVTKWNLPSDAPLVEQW